MVAGSREEIEVGDTCSVLRPGCTKRRRAVIIETRTDKESDQREYYVHYEGTDRRMDEWTKRNMLQKIIVAKAEVSFLKHNIRKRNPVANFRSGHGIVNLVPMFL